MITKIILQEKQNPGLGTSELKQYLILKRKLQKKKKQH